MAPVVSTQEITVAQLDPTQYKKLTAGMVYGQSDGLYWDNTNSRLILVIDDTTVAVIDSTGITADLEVSGNVRGDLLRRGASALERFAAKAAGQVIIGDGTDVISAALGGDVSTVSSAGSVVLANPQRLLSATVAIPKTAIVGTDAGDLGHAAGVQLVAAVATKIIEPIAIVLNYTFDTAAYTAGGNVSAIYQGGAAATGVVTAANSFGAAASNINVLRPLSGLALVNTDLRLIAASGFTDPGTAAGTISATTYYRLISA